MRRPGCSALPFSGHGKDCSRGEGPSTLPARERRLCGSRSRTILAHPSEGGPMSTKRRRTPIRGDSSEADPELQLARFIDKFEPELKTVIVQTRKALRKRLPSANEIVYDNYNFFVIGYSSTE